MHPDKFGYELKLTWNDEHPKPYMESEHDKSTQSNCLRE